MNTLEKKLNKIFHKVESTPNLEAALIGSGFYSYVWYRFRYFILTTTLFYVFFFIKNIFLGDNYTSFYTTTIIVYEQFVFWFSQIFWFFIISIQKDKMNLSKTPLLLDRKIALYYAALVATVVGFILYRNGLIVFDQISIYSLVSGIFIIQIFAVIYLKYMHAHIYAHKRVFVNVPLVMAFTILTLILQIVLWNIYSFWSIPIVFGIQVAAASLVRYFFYQKDFKNRLVENHLLIGFKKVCQSLISKSTIISLVILLPEISYFGFIHFKFIDTLPYTSIFVLLSVLINSRMPALLLQDFIKYDTDKYNTLITKYINKLSIPLFFGLVVLYAQVAFVNKLTSDLLNYELILFCFLSSYFMSIQSLITYYFFSKRNLFGVAAFSFLTCIVIYFSINYLQLNNILAGSILLVSITTVYLLICKNLNKFSNLLLEQRLFLFKNFKYLVIKKSIPFIYELQLDQIGVFNKKISILLEEHLKQSDLIYIANTKRIFLASTKDGLNPQFFFYCKKINLHTGFDSILDQEQLNHKAQIDDFKNLSNSPYNLKVLFSGLIKQQSGFRKKLLKK